MAAPVKKKLTIQRIEEIDEGLSSMDDVFTPEQLADLKKLCDTAKHNADSYT